MAKKAAEDVTEAATIDSTVAAASDSTVDKTKRGRRVGSDFKPAFQWTDQREEALMEAIATAQRGTGSMREVMRILFARPDGLFRDTVSGDVTELRVRAHIVQWRTAGFNVPRFQSSRKHIDVTQLKSLSEKYGVKLDASMEPPAGSEGDSQSGSPDSQVENPADVPAQ